MTLRFIFIFLLFYGASIFAKEWSKDASIRLSKEAIRTCNQSSDCFASCSFGGSFEGLVFESQNKRTEIGMLRRVCGIWSSCSMSAGEMHYLRWGG